MNTYKSNGLCEYISYTTLLNYFLVFGRNSYYTSDQLKQYYNNRIDKNGVFHVNHGKGNKNAVPRLIYNKNNKIGDIKLGKTMNSINKTWLGETKFNKLITDWSASWMHTSNPETWISKYHVPVMVSFYKTSGIAHSVLIYGYNQKTKEYAVNYGWPSSTNKDFGKAIIKKSDLWFFSSMGFWYGMREK